MDEEFEKWQVREEAQNRITALEKEVEELRKDKERLLWVISNPYRFYTDWVYSTHIPANSPVHGRQIIDAAIDSAAKEDKHN